MAQNTIIIFGSDHGEYAGAHGFVAGKILSCYEEAFHVPLVVVDPGGRYAGDTDTVRTELTSSVDMMPLLVSLGHNGSRAWMTGPLREIYGRRHNMVPMLRSASAPGRRHILFATDELVPGTLIFNDAPLHIIGLRTQAGKLGTYTKWTPTGQIDPRTIELEFYDYGTPDGVAEVTSNPNDPRVPPTLRLLFGRLVHAELRAPLPGLLAAAQQLSRGAYLLLAQRILNGGTSGSSRSTLRDLLGYGRPF